MKMCLLLQRGRGLLSVQACECRRVIRGHPLLDRPVSTRAAEMINSQETRDADWDIAMPTVQIVDDNPLVLPVFPKPGHNHRQDAYPTE